MTKEGHPEHTNDTVPKIFNPVILCVDDEETHLNLIEAVLRSNGYQVISASNGQDALLKINSHTIDLVLLDIRMPGMDGFEVCRRIKEDQKFVDMPIVMLTGLTSSEDHIRGIEVGVADYFTKPIKKAELLARVKILLKVKKLSDERRQAEEALKKSHDELEYQVQLRTAELVKANEMLQADIAERKRIQEALCESEALYRLLADNATDIIWIVGMDMHLTYVSPSVTSLLGFTVEETKARTMQQAYTPEAFAKAMQMLGEEMAIESSGQGDPNRSRMEELELVRKDGNAVPIEGNFRFLRDSTGKAIGILSIVRDMTERKRIEAELRDSEQKYRVLSMLDELTQLNNSRYFYIQLKNEMERSNRYGHPLTLLLLDLDDFKAFNDAYGHIEGNQVLIRLGQVMKRCLRMSDSAYRYGGEEFTILLPMTTSAGAAVIAERIQMEFKKQTFLPEQGKEVHMTVSIGFGQYRPNEEMQVFVHRVDQCMYQAKKDGKDRICSEP